MNRPRMGWLARVAATALVAWGCAYTTEVRAARPLPHKAAAIPTVDPLLIPNAEDQLAAAKSAVATAQNHLNSVVRGLEKTWENRADVTSAKEAVAAASQEYTTAAAPLLIGLQNQPAYIAAVERRDELAKKMTALREGEGSATGDPALNFAAADEAFASRKVVTDMELSVINVNPTAAAVHQKFVEAGAVYEGLRRKFEESIKEDSDWKSAEQEVVDSHKKVADAEQALIAARELHAKQQAAHDAAVAKAAQHAGGQGRHGHRR